MSKVTLWILFLAVLLYGCFCLFLYLRQRSLIYYPHSEVKTSELQSFWLDNEGQKLKVWRGATESKNALLYFGGTGGIVMTAGILIGLRFVRIFFDTSELALGSGLAAVLLSIVGMIFISTGFILHSVRGLLTELLDRR